MIMCGSRTLKEESEILKLSWRHQNFEMLELCVTCSGKLLPGNKTTHRKRILLHCTKHKGVGDLKITLTTDVELLSLEISQLVLVLIWYAISS